MNVLVINCGSSSLKYQLINSDSEEVLAKGLCERSASTEDWFTRKRDATRRSQRRPCPPTKRPSRWFLRR